MKLLTLPSGTVEVTLSKRNLLALLHKLEMEGSAWTLVTEGLIVRCESDETHYADRDVPPGQMHPQTEAFLKES